MSSTIRIKSVTISNRDYSSRSRRNQLYVFESSSTGTSRNISEILQERYSKPYNFYRKEVIPVVKKWLTAEGRVDVVQYLEGKWTWSQKAGCACGCSPGFLGDRYMSKDITVVFEIVSDLESFNLSEVEDTLSQQ